MARPARPAAFVLVLLAWCLPPGCHREGPSRAGRAPEDALAADGSGDDEARREAGPASGPGAQPEPAPPLPPELPADGSCHEPEDVVLFVSPRRPMDGEPLRVVVVSDRQIPGAALWARSPAGEVVRLEQRHFWGPPSAWSAVIAEPGRGVWRVVLATGPTVHTCEDIRMRVVRHTRTVTDVVWPVHEEWSRAFENLYSAWIMQLFWAPPGERPSWSALHDVLRDPERNFLYNRLGLGEDGPDRRRAITATPDCADAPYYLRAYFAWKMRLPFVFSSCSRGRGGAAPVCHRTFSNLEPPVEGLRAAGVLQPDQSFEDLDGSVDGSVEPIGEEVAFDRFMNGRVVGIVQSGAGRTLPGDERADFYPIELSRESIRPGTIFVDPYGHLLVVAMWVDQGEGSPGLLFAIDGHPDQSIGRKRFWQGAFLFVDDMSWGAGGFKAFRPVVARQRRGEWEVRTLSNAEIAAHPAYGNHSDEQYRLGTEGFYERMERVVNPTPLEPHEAQRAMLEAFHELVLERVDSVAAGETFMAARRHAPISMPDGPEIFETAGAWEDYSTPARDLRLLIALDLVLGLPDRVTANPGAFAFSRERTPTEVAEGMRAMLRDYLASHHVSYVRSNGRPARLSLADVVARRTALEMAYNPNDCAEIRWGAPETSEERSSCRRRAPDEQLERMEGYREWFRTRSRPPRR